MVCEIDTLSRRAARVSAVWIIFKAKEIRSIHYIMPVPPARIDMAAATARSGESCKWARL